MPRKRTGCTACPNRRRSKHPESASPSARCIVEAGRASVETVVWSTFQGAKVSDQCLDVGIIQLCGEPRHFTFDAFFNNPCNSSIGFLQVVKARTFIATRVISMAMSAIAVK